MQAATNAQPATATLLVSSHGGGAVASHRRRISAAAINPPANGSQALACREKKDDPVASCWLAHRHHANDRTAKTCSVTTTALIPDMAREASRQTRPTISGMKK